MNILLLLESKQNLFLNTNFACLLITTLLYWASFSFKFLGPLRKVGFAMNIIANLSLVMILGTRWLVHGYFPLSNLYESLLFLCWSLLAIYLYLESKTGSKIVGALLLPVALLISAFADLTLPVEMQRAASLVPALQSNWLMLHVSLMMVSYATLISGSLLSILFLVLTLKKPNASVVESTEISSSTLILNETTLGSGKNPAFSGLSKMTSNIDNLSYRIISFGFPLLTIGIIAGAVWANEAWGSYWSWDPKETWALITWFVYAAYLHARIVKGWSAAKSSILGAVGFVTVWICYLGVNFLGQGLHSYGWLS